MANSIYLWDRFSRGLSGLAINPKVIGGAFSPLSLFSSGEEGAWYEPSPTSTFTDIGGYTFATYGQTVSHLIDKSQGATIEARRNRLFYTEQFNNSYWDKFTRSSIAPDDQVSPNGDLTGDKVNCVETSANGFFVRRNNDIPIPNNGVIVVSCYFKQGSRPQAMIVVLSDSLTSGIRATFDLSAVEFADSNTVGSGWSVVGTPTISSTSNGWYRCSVTVQTSGSATRVVLYPSLNSISDFSCTNGVDFGYMWGAQLEAGSSASAYQKITDGQTVSWLPGNHATQITADNRPTLARVPVTGRRNLLERTEEFDDAVWIKGSDGSVAQDATGVDGQANTAFTLTDSGSTAAGIYQQVTVPADTASYTGTVYFKKTTSASTFPMMGVNFGLASVQGDVIVNTDTGDLEDRPSLAPTGSTIEDAGDYWKVTVTNANDGSQTTARVVIYPAISDDGTTIDTSLTGSCVADQVQLEAGSTATAYQKVVSEYDVTEAGVDSVDYLSFSTNDGMATASIDFTGTDKMSVFAGLEKLSETDTGEVVELSAAWGTNNGAFSLAVNLAGGTEDYYASLRGTINEDASTDDNQPALAVLSALHDISGDSTVLRVNGSQQAQNTADKGTGNFGDYPLNIGARNNAESLWFNGNLYGLIVRGATSTTDEIDDTETYLAQRVSGFSAPTITGLPTIGVS